MAHVKRDKRLVRYATVAAVFGTFCPLGLYLAIGVSAAVVGIFGVVVLFGCGVAWLQNFYRCPECGCRLESETSLRGTHDPIRHHCTVCDVVWVSGIEVGSSGLL
jgi:hypothetical protein